MSSTPATRLLPLAAPATRLAGWNAVSMASMLVLQLLVGFPRWSFDPEYAAIGSLLIVQLQVGQTLGMNVSARSSRALPERHEKALRVCALAFLMLALAPRSAISVPASAGFASMVGVAIGFRVGEHPEHTARFNTLRNGVWIALLVPVWSFHASPFALALTLVSAGLLSNQVATQYGDRAESTDRQRIHLLPVVFGLMAATVYRNDVTIVRASVDDSRAELVHYALIAYTACVAVAGIGSVQLLIPRLRARKPTATSSWWYVVLAAPVAAVVTLVVAGAEGSDDRTVAVALIAAAPIAIGATVLATHLHYAGRSNWVYAVALFAMIPFAVAPQEYAVGALLASALIRFAGLFIVRIATRPYK